MYDTMQCGVCFEYQLYTCYACHRCKFRICKECINNNKEIILKSIYLRDKIYIYCSLQCIYLQLTNNIYFTMDEVINDIIHWPHRQYFTESIHNHQTHLYNVIYINQLTVILVDWFIKDIGKLIISYCEIDD